MQTKHLLIILALAQFVLALLYLGVTPYRRAGFVNGSIRHGFQNGQLVKDYGAPDERQHANYVGRLISGEGLPIFDPKDPNLYENYQGHQPPLFYVLDAAWCKVIGISDMNADGAINARAINALIGSATVIGIFFLGLWGLRSHEVGLLGAAFVAFLPMFGALSGALSNDPLLFCLCTWSLALLARQIQDGFTLKYSLILGLLIGLASLTKTTAVSLLPVLFVAGFFVRKDKSAVRLLGAALGLSLVIAVPWWIRNQSLYGDPLAIKAFNEAFVGSPKSSDFIEGLGAMTFWRDMFFYFSLRSFFGVFGYMDIFMNKGSTSYMGPEDPNILYLALFLATSTMVGYGIKWSFRDAATKEKQVICVLSAFTFIIIALYLKFNLQYFQAQSRYIFPAIGPIALCFGAGVLSLARRNWKIGLGVVVAILGAFNFYTIKRLPREFALRSGDEIVRQKALAEEAQANSQ